VTGELPGPGIRIEFARQAVESMADRRSFERGLLYAANGRVGKRTVTELSLTTMVRGSASYKVKLWIGAEETTFNCSCLSGFEGVRGRVLQGRGRCRARHDRCRGRW